MSLPVLSRLKIRESSFRIPLEERLKFRHRNEPQGTATDDPELVEDVPLERVDRTAQCLGCLTLGQRQPEWRSSSLLVVAVQPRKISSRIRRNKSPAKRHFRPKRGNRAMRGSTART
jgi:hypothetical protein